MPLTIKDYLDPKALPDGFVVPHLAGKVKLAWAVKPPTSAGGNDYGPSQGFVLETPDGDIQIQLGSDSEADFPGPVEKGDEVEIFATPHGKTGAPSGNKLASYTGKDGKLVRQIKVYGKRRFRNLTRSAPELRQECPPVSPHVPSNGSVAHSVAPLGEVAAVATYLRLYTRFAAEFSPRLSPAIHSLEGFIVEAPVELLDLCHRMAYGLFAAVLTGNVTPETSATPQPTTNNSSAPTTGPVPDPDWMQGLEEP